MIVSAAEGAMSRMTVQEFGRLAFCLAVGVTVAFSAVPSAHANIAYPHYFTASQSGRNVELNVVLEYIWWEEENRMPRCLVELHRRAGDGGYDRLYRGDLGEATLDCPEVCGANDQQICCLRRCRTFVDTCPSPGELTYRVRLLDSRDFDGYPDELHASILVWPSTGTCDAPPGTVTSNEGCGCGTGIGAIWSHMIVLLTFGLAVLVGFRRRKGAPRGYL